MVANGFVHAVPFCGFLRRALFWHSEVYRKWARKQGLCPVFWCHVESSRVQSSRVVSCRHRLCGGWFISHGLLVKLSRPLGTSVDNALCLPSPLTEGCWARGASCMISSPHTGFVGSRFGCAGVACAVGAVVSSGGR